MAKQINISFENKNYCLEFKRRTVEILERQGFTITDIDKKPTTLLPMLFEGAFLANHRNIKKGIIDKIYEQIPNKTELLGKLAEMYNEPLETLMADPEGSEGKAQWATNW